MIDKRNGMKKTAFVFAWLWQSPQHVLALAIGAFLTATGRIEDCRRNANPPGDTVYIVKRSGWGVSLGRYIFIGDACCAAENIRHERGHSFQSLAMGPLYLALVGLPSAIGNNVWDRLMHREWPDEKRVKWYYSRYPEAGADRLGGILRPWSV
jgi:hypothetical protein